MHVNGRSEANMPLDNISKRVTNKKQGTNPLDHWMKVCSSHYRPPVTWNLCKSCLTNAQSKLWHIQIIRNTHLITAQCGESTMWWSKTHNNQGPTATTKENWNAQQKQRKHQERCMDEICTEINYPTKEWHLQRTTFDRNKMYAKICHRWFNALA